MAVGGGVSLLRYRNPFREGDGGRCSPTRMAGSAGQTLGRETRVSLTSVMSSKALPGRAGGRGGGRSFFRPSGRYPVGQARADKGWRKLLLHLQSPRTTSGRPLNNNRKKLGEGIEVARPPRAKPTWGRNTNFLPREEAKFLRPARGGWDKYLKVMPHFPLSTG